MGCRCGSAARARGRELVKGAQGGERPRGVVRGDAQGLVVVDEVGEASAAVAAARGAGRERSMMGMETQGGASGTEA